jgi:hypothetical protein
MINLALARARIRARLARGDEESGFALIYVLAVTTMIALLVGSTLVVTTGAVVPAVQSAYDQAADAAAQSGVQDFVTHLDAWCNTPSTATVSSCTPQTTAMGPTSIDLSNSDGSYTASYSWTAEKWIPASDPNGGYFRVRSTGTVQEGGLSATKVVIGDVVPGGSQDLLNYGVVTAFETQSSSTVLADWPERYIALDAAAKNAADVPIKGDNIHWSGSQPGTAAGTVSVCNATFDAKGGRSNNPPPGAPNPYVDFTESGLNGNNYRNYEPCHTSWGHMTELLAPADQGSTEPGEYYSADTLLLSNSFPGGTGPLFNQPVRTGWQWTSQDANVCGTAEGRSYRSFTLICPGLNYNVEVGGSPNPNSKYPDVVWKDPAGSPTIPSTVNYGAVPNANQCVYLGPTRVVLKADGTALVTSPQTTSTFATTSGYPSQCYTGAGAQGMAEQVVDLTNIKLVRAEDNGSVPTTTPAIAHGSSGWPLTGQQAGDTPSTSNSVFYMTNGTSGTSSTTTNTATAADKPYTPAVGDDPNEHSDAAWTPQWLSFNSGTTCDTSSNATGLKFFNCYQSPSSGYNATEYSAIKAKVQADLAAAPTNYDTASELQAYLTNLLAPGNSADAANNTPTYADNRSHRWNVTVTQDSSATDGCTPGSNVTGSTTTSKIAAPSSDPFYSNVDGSVAATPKTTTVCLTARVTLQIGQSLSGVNSWGDGGLLGSGLLAGSSIPQFKVTTTNQTVVTTTVTTPAVSSFPAMSDVTQYQMGFDNTGNGNTDTFAPNGPGDLYVEGEAAHTMVLIADDDTVITGSTGPAGTNPTNPSTTTDNRDPDCGNGTGVACPVTPALEIVGRNNVRVYHPVKCNNSFGIASATFQSEITATTPGFCPNDITGLYTSLPALNARPNEQYANLRQDLAGLTVHAAVFALGNAAAHITCPQPPEGGGICGGEFTLDNYDRGDALGYLTEIGVLGMAHHSPVGEEWEIADTTGQSSRLYSGYQLAQQYQNLKASLQDFDSLLTTSVATNLLWHILSVSAATTATGGG